MSAKKAVRQTKRKKEHNQLWKRRIRVVTKQLKELLAGSGQDAGILKEQASALQKILDKAAKEKVIHKNKADRLKARFARKIAVHEQNKQQPKSKPVKRTRRNTRG
jgi:small subunit ribosomal protein S20